MERHGFEKDEECDNKCPYDLRVKGLTQQLSRGEIYRVVQHILKKRGISYLDDDADMNANNSSEYTQELEKNAELLDGKTPGEIQLDRLLNGGRVRTGINQNGSYQLNVFTVGAYADELRRVLTNQSQYYQEIDQNFIDFYTNNDPEFQKGLIYRKRPYYHGPGDKNNPSEYGRWKNYPSEGKPQENIFDQLVGVDLCGHVRASGAGKSAQIYNLLNDLNNLTLPREDPKILVEEKEKILSYLLNDEVKTFGPAKLARMLGHQVSDIKGWRVDAKDKPQIHTLKTYRKWKEIFDNAGVPISEFSDQDFDTLADIITLNSEKDAVEKTIELKLSHLRDGIKIIILDNFADLKKATAGVKWHAFSTETLNLIIPELLNTSNEQNTILEYLGLKPDLRKQYADEKSLPAKEIVENIYNPTVSRSVRQSIKILNHLVKQYGKDNITHVSIEMPRDNNDDDRKRTIREIQKSNKKRKDSSEQYFLEQSGWDADRLAFELRRRKFAQKLYYYYEQQGRCVYSGKRISPEDLLSDKTEIDHILPLSLSLDDSMNNKVLVLSAANQSKGQRTPFQAFNDGSLSDQTWEDYKQSILQNRYYKKSKRFNLLFTEDISKPNIHKRFINRNLNDTRYASKVVLGAVQSFFYGSDTKVKVITGSFTHTLRKQWGYAMEKTRDTYHHHAVDATLCAVSPFVRITPYTYEYDEETQTSWMIHKDSDGTEINRIPYHEYKKRMVDDRRIYTPKWDHFIESLYPVHLHSKIKFSHKVDKKYNRKLSDETIYSTRVMTTTKMKRGEEVTENKEMVLGKIKDIYSPEGYQEYLKHKDQLLIKELDPKSFDILESISQEFLKKHGIDEQSNHSKVDASAFQAYIEDNGLVGIQKYSKKNNGPLIRQLKYYNKALGKHLNVTKDPQGNAIDKTVNNRRTVMLSLKPWRTDVYYDPTNERYRLVGVKYADLRFMNGTYGIPEDVYQELKENEGIEDHFQFMFSLYKNDRVLCKKGDESIEVLFQSKNESNKDYLTFKPIDKPRFSNKEKVPVFGLTSSGGILTKGVSKLDKMIKINTDMVGNTYLSAPSTLI